MRHLKQKLTFHHHVDGYITVDTVQNTLQCYSIIPPLTLFVTTELLRHQKSGNLDVYYGRCVFIWSGDGL